jgi:quercetin dioxygenase-like cupin family protein
MDQNATRAFPDYAYVRRAEVDATIPEPGLTRRLGAHNDKIFLIEHRMVKGWAGARHSHPHEQVVYVVSGRLKVTCGSDTFEVGTGDSFVVRGNIEHQASALEDSIVIDCFTPCRYDYL